MPAIPAVWQVTTVPLTKVLTTLKLEIVRLGGLGLPIFDICSVRIGVGLSAGSLSVSPRLTGLTDQDLLRELHNGTDDALGVLFDRHYRSVFSLVYRILRDGVDAEQMMQEVFLDIYWAAGEFDSTRDSVNRWILARAKRQLLVAGKREVK